MGGRTPENEILLEAYANYSAHLVSKSRRRGTWGFEQKKAGDSGIPASDNHVVLWLPLNPNTD